MGGIGPHDRVVVLAADLPDADAIMEAIAGRAGDRRSPRRVLVAQWLPHVGRAAVVALPPVEGGLGPRTEVAR